MMVAGLNRQFIRSINLQNRKFMRKNSKNIFTSVASLCRMSIGKSSAVLFKNFTTNLDESLDFSVNFAENGINFTKKDFKKLKVRQHVNPLSETYQKRVQLDPNWLEKIFVRSEQNIVIDVGCAKGTWMLKNALENKDKNYLGLEIRRPVVDYCNERAIQWNIHNAHCMAANANIDLPLILKDLMMKGVPIDMVTIHHPDPHFKKKHKKRRVVTPEIVSEIGHILNSDCPVFMQSDIKEVAMEMAQTFLDDPLFVSAEGYDPNRLAENPSPHAIMTEREIATLRKGLNVYRMLVKRV